MPRPSARQTGASDRLSAYSKGRRQTESERESAVIQALGTRSFHVPGNNWCQDYIQYFRNNHPFFGICCHDRRHPIKFWQRIVILIGSIAFGLAVTNFIVLYFLRNPQAGVAQRFFTVSISANITSVNGDNPEFDEITVTTGQLFLWTVGGALHSMFDLSVWYISACVCCLPGGFLECLGRCKVLGNYIVIFATVVIVALSSFIVVLRATIDSNDDVDLADLTSGGLVDDEIHIGQVESIESYRFVVSWLIEVAVALFVWNPLLGTILFSGITGCYRLPFFGGRPRDVLVEERKQQMKRSVENV